MVSILGRMRSPQTWRSCYYLPLILLLAGCGGRDLSSTPSKPADKSAGDEYWDVCFIQGQRVGYQHTVIKPFQEGGQPLVEVVVENQMVVKRYGQLNTLTTKISSVESPAGDPVRFSTETDFSSDASKVTGTIVGKEIVVQVNSGGKEETSKVPFSPDVKGYYGLYNSFVAAPLKPGETRKLRVIWPFVNQVADVSLVAKDFELVKLIDTEQELLHVDVEVAFANGVPMRMTAWTDRSGQRLKEHADAMNMDTVRTTKYMALEKSDSGKLDLGTDTLVLLEKPLANPYDLTRARYRVQVGGDDPAKVFTRSLNQQINSIDANTAEITVTAVQAQQRSLLATPMPKPTAAELNPNGLVQSDDPAVVRMAQEAKGNLKDPVEIALALEKYVYRAIDKKNFSQKFASAAEVAKSREGDCTEHAVLLAALARACGIGSRGVIGLLYVEGSQGFGYHMWTEVYLEDRWVPLDARMGRGGIGPAHLKLTDSSLEGTSAYSSFLPVAQVLGRLKITVLDAE